MEVKHGNVDIVEELCMVFHGVAAREEYDDLLFEILLQECEEEEKAAIGGADNVSLR